MRPIALNPDEPESTSFQKNQLRFQTPQPKIHSMALAKKGTRTIVVNDIRYRWLVAENSETLHLVIELAQNPGQRLEAVFTYHDHFNPNVPPERQIFSPKIVREIILFALTKNWRPTQRGLQPLRFQEEELPLRMHLHKPWWDTINS